METYTINDVAKMTGFTTRTLRNYIGAGLLEGEKTEGVWKFTPEDFSKFISHPSVFSGIKSKHQAQVFDFLVNDTKKENQICTILDFYVSDGESSELSDFFCQQMNAVPESRAKLSLHRNGQNTRIILSGPETVVSDILHCYYDTKNGDSAPVTTAE